MSAPLDEPLPLGKGELITPRDARSAADAAF
jgi:hypothetical protein